MNEPNKPKRGRPKSGDLTHREAARIVGISISTLYAAIQEGVNPYNLEELRRWRDNGRYCEKRDGRK